MREESLEMEENHEDSQREKAVVTLECEIRDNLLGLHGAKYRVCSDNHFL
jgi:hypothetical protein